MRRSGPLVIAAGVSVFAAGCASAGGRTGVEAVAPPGPAGADRITVEQIAGDPPDDVASALDVRTDPSFPDPLVDTDLIVSGGPPPDGIPPIDDPVFQTASTVDWLADVEPVLILQIDGEARAYPVQILTWHEIVNDTFGSIPVTVSFCPLCNSAVAYRRDVGDRILDFGTSGSLFNSSLVMYDRQTESLWSHFTGQAVVGALTGTELELIPMSTVSWATFLESHPDGLVLTRETGFSRDYGRNPYVGYDDVDSSPLLFRGETDGRLPPQTRVVAVRSDTGSVAVVHDDLSAVGVIEIVVDGAPAVAMHVAGTASALDSAAIPDGRDVGATGVFRPVVGDRTVELTRTDDDRFVDAVTGSLFDVLGRGIEGELTGATLERIAHLDTFWFAIAAFEPDTEIVGPTVATPRVRE